MCFSKGADLLFYLVVGSAMLMVLYFLLRDLLRWVRDEVRSGGGWKQVGVATASVSGMIALVGVVGSSVIFLAIYLCTQLYCPYNWLMA